MTQKLARYSVTNGLVGCYMPDGNHGPISFATRKEMADYIRSELEQTFPNASGRQLRALFREADIRKVWGFIQRNGSSVAHFSLQLDGYELAFHGLTEAEFDAAEKEQDQ
jgi:hypothetical protein